MSATMARQGGRAQLEQSDMRLALNMAKTANGRFLRVSIGEMQQLIKKPCAEVREEMKREVEFPGQKKVKAALERHLAMVYRNHTAGCLPCQNGTAKNPQTRWRHTGTDAPPRDLVSPLPGMPSAPGSPPSPLGEYERYQHFEIEGILSRCVYMHSSLPNTECLNHIAFAQHCRCDKDFISDLPSILSTVWKYR
jgi:hypothetical protein